MNKARSVIDEIVWIAMLITANWLFVAPSMEQRFGGQTIPMLVLFGVWSFGTGWLSTIFLPRRN